jgi:cytochrome c-type biogenesis protein CcsB
VNIQDWAVVSDRAIMFASIVYALSFVSYIVEWAISRTLEPAESKVLAGSGEADAAPEPSDKEVRADAFGRIGVSLLVLGTALQAVGLVARGLATDPIRVPWGNMYEFTLAGTFGMALTYLVLMRRYDLRWLGMVVSGFLVVVLMLDTSVLYKDAGPVMPALHSYWLAIHVLAAIVATGAFAVAAMLSALYLIKERAERGGPLRPSGFLAQLPPLEALDRVAYRLNAIGFPIWTFAALIAGPIWAKYAWGSYWNWDPKEVWAFITWVGYACYLHARATAGFKGRVAAVIALVAFATLLFNFVGINFFFGGDSAHSYAK